MIASWGLNTIESAHTMTVPPQHQQQLPNLAATRDRQHDAPKGDSHIFVFEANTAAGKGMCM